MTWLSNLTTWTNKSASQAKNWATGGTSTGLNFQDGVGTYKDNSNAYVNKTYTYGKNEDGSIMLTGVESSANKSMIAMTGTGMALNAAGEILKAKYAGQAQQQQELSNYQAYQQQSYQLAQQQQKEQAAQSMQTMFEMAMMMKSLDKTTETS